MVGGAIVDLSAEVDLSEPRPFLDPDTRLLQKEVKLQTGGARYAGKTVTRKSREIGSMLCL